jgi:biotin carboxylase
VTGSEVSDSSAGGGALPRLAFVYHPRSFGALALAEAAAGTCELIWIIDSSDSEIDAMARLLRRIGDVIDIAGMSLEDAAATIAVSRPAGILSLADSLLVWTARVADLLDLEFVSIEAAEALTDKYLQRAALRRAGVAVPGYWLVPDEDQADAWSSLAQAATFPAVLKPRRGEASRDTARVSSLEEVRAIALGVAGESESGRAELVLEEYLQDRPQAAGHHFADYVSVESVVSDGCVSHLAITGRFPPAEPFRETGFFIPCAFDEEECTAIAELATAAVRALGVEVGSLHTEVKLTPQGPRVIELNGRIGGGVPEMLADATGIKLLPLAMRVALGESIAFATMPQCSQIGYLLYVQAPRSVHTIRAVDGLEQLRARPGVEQVTLNRGPGSDVDWRAGNHDHVFSVSGAVPDLQLLRSIERYANTEVQIHGD